MVSEERLVVSEARLAELEIKLSYQEETISVLNDAIYQQQIRLDRLEVLLQGYRDQLSRTNSEPSDSSDRREKPPHY